MATRRQGNWLGQMRVDVADLRSVESGVAADFDILAGKMIAGRTPLVVRGFTIATTNVAGTAANQLQLYVAAGLILHFGASEAGTLFVADDNAASQILSASNSLVQGTFTAGSVNYVGIDFRRSADTTTSDLKQFLDAGTLKEVAKTVPTARTLQLKIVITTQPFSVSSNICPIAKVQTDSSNNIVSVTDARQMMFRLGAGSDVPNAASSFSWASRTENPVTYSSGGVDPFSGADKSITSLKQWMDAVMSRLWEVGSGEHWYSPTARERLKIVYGQPVQVSTGDNFAWTVGTNTLAWSGISILFENATTAGVYYNAIQDGSNTLTANGQCLYVDIDRSSNATALIPAVGNLQTLGIPAIPGSRVILAWRQNNLIFSKDRPYEVSRALQVATTSVVGVVKLNNTPGSSSAPVVPVIMANGQIEIGATTNSTAAIKGTGGAGGVGVQGVSLDSGDGVLGTSVSGIGVHGTGSGIGSTGIKGEGPTGVLGSGTSIGGDFGGATTGVVAQATAGNGNGLSATGFGTGYGAIITGGSGGGTAVHAIPGAGSTIAVLADGIVQSSTGGFKFPDSSTQDKSATQFSNASFSNVANITVDVSEIRRYGNVVVLYLQLTPTASFAASASLGSIAAAICYPNTGRVITGTMLVSAGNYAHAPFSLNAAGLLSTYNALTSGQTVYLGATYAGA